jgi:two-component system chemotaxis response regulator CheB
MRKIRVLIVDDSVVVRRIVTRMLSDEPDIEVVGTAANGRIALARLQGLNPDAIVLDVEMPEMDGLATLAALRKTHARLPVIMFSTLTERGASATLDALSLGASDYVTKPSSIAMPASLEAVRQELIGKLKLFCSGPAETVAQAGRSAKSALPPALFAAPERAHRKPAEIVAIGVSTGGPNALAELMPGFPAELAVPLLIVQHMPPIFTRLLAERLAARSRIPIMEAQSGQLVRPGHAYLAPGDFHLVVERRGDHVHLRTNQEPPENWCRPAADVLFRSVASAYRGAALAVVMTGMGQDGLRGCEEIRRAGGQVLAQDEASSVVWGMPGFVVRAGLADRVAPLGELAGEIMQRVRNANTGQVKSPSIPRTQL